jgi:hypothetical protein
MNFVIEPWFHRKSGIRYKMERTMMVPVPETGAVIEVPDPAFETMYFGTRTEAETAKAIEVAKAGCPLYGIYDFINLANRTVADHFADELAVSGKSSWDAFLALPKIERAFLRIRYVETVICPQRTGTKAEAEAAA